MGYLVSSFSLLLLPLVAFAAGSWSQFSKTLTRHFSLIYGVCCIVTLVWVTFVVPETRGVPVGKEMDTVFGKKEEEEEESGAEAETAPLLQNEYRRTSVVSYT